MERDPRIDPRAGDVLTGLGDDGVRRGLIVDSVSKGQVYFWRTISEVEDKVQHGEHWRITLERWAQEAANAEVIRRGGQ